MVRPCRHRRAGRECAGRRAGRSARSPSSRVVSRCRRGKSRSWARPGPSVIGEDQCGHDNGDDAGKMEAVFADGEGEIGDSYRDRDFRHALAGRMEEVEWPRRTGQIRREATRETRAEARMASLQSPEPTVSMVISTENSAIAAASLKRLSPSTKRVSRCGTLISLNRATTATGSVVETMAASSRQATRE